MGNFRKSRSFTAALLLIIGGTVAASSLQATDYFLTIGGGYSRTGNQASLEANVVFFQQLLADRHRGERRHDVFFADGHDSGADLQIVAEKQTKSETPATDLLAVLHRRQGGAQVGYRNHRVPEINGPLDPKLIRTALEDLAEKAKAGDRLIVYVTAHGSPGPRNDQYNTTIDCWNQRKITAREFTGWLNKLPAEVPVVMVMAQCYCGGFSRTIFEDFDEKKGPTERLRAGFFAQQHDLPAAGCRPDIEHDEEFSSYFWGAIAGRTRNGVPIEGCDVNGDGVVSFAEAHAYAVIAGATIDIPLRTSEVFLRGNSKLKDDRPEEDVSSEGEEKKPALFLLEGDLETILEGSRPIARHIVTQLAKTLDLSLQDKVFVIRTAWDESRRPNRMRGGRGRGPRNSGRRELLAEVAEKWPELGDERKWEDSPLLKAENQATLLAELQELPAWKNFDARREQADVADKAADQREIRSIKFRRLMQTLESIVLEKNLPRFASPEVQERYRKLTALEESALNAGKP